MKQERIGNYIVNTYNSNGVKGRQVNKLLPTNSQLRKARYKENIQSANSSLSLLKIVFISILLFGVVGNLTGTGRTLTFTGFLQILANAPKIPTDWISFNTFTFNISSALVDYTWLNNLLNSFTSIIQVLLFAFVGITQLVVFLLYFLRLMFF